MTHVLRHIAILASCCFWLTLATAQRNTYTIPTQWSLEEYPEIAENILRHLENNGYPFASISLQTDSLSAQPVFCIDTGIFVTFDSIVIKGDAKLSPSYLYPYLGIKRGRPYQESVVQQIDKLLGDLPFVDVVRPTGVAFVKDKAIVYLYLNKRTVNQFDGYVGITPQDENSGKIAFHGELDLALANLFRLGERITLHWQSSNRHSQNLDITAEFDYLFRTHFGLEGNFNLDKHDTSYLLLHYHIGIPYTFYKRNSLTTYFDYRSSSILNPALLDLSSDSACIDYSKRMYGVRIYFRETDAVLVPRKGWEGRLDASVGRRIIRENAHADASLYHNIEMKKTNYRIEMMARGYVPLGKRFSMVPNIQFGSLLTGPHFYNELFYIGGEERIRGFNPNDIAASTFLLYSLEMRFHFMKNSFFMLFFDGGVYEQAMANHYERDIPFGFGAGLNMAVRSGLFYLSYAMGRQQGNPLSFRTGKIHFGIKVAF